MTISRSARFMKLRDEITSEYKTPPADPRDLYWWKNFAPKWRNRVGLPRLTAERAFSEAAGLLRSVNSGIFRNDPEMEKLFAVALNGVKELSQEFGRQNWERFEGKTDTEGKS